MAKLVVINSFGPMGSTLLAGLVEKLGFSNVPLRKTNLHQYLMREIPLASGVMQKRVVDIIREHGKSTTRSGGVSVIDRDSQKSHALVDPEKVRQRLEEFSSTKFETLQDLYQASRKLYLDAVTYKEVTTKEEWHIEMTVDTSRYDPAALYKNYIENFDDVKMIHLHRDFRGWINSLSSQAMTHPHLKNKIMFFPHLRYDDYDLYERAIEKIPGLHLDFKDLFTPVEDLAQKIAKFVEVPIPALDLRRESYDLYGRILPYETAFKPFDDNVNYLPPATLDYLTEQAQAGMKTPVSKLTAWLRYLDGLRRYQVSRSFPSGTT